MDKTIQYPTDSAIKNCLSKLSETKDQTRHENELDYSAIKNTDIALNELMSKFPDNSKLSEIYLKVTAINSLYSTNIYDTFKIALNIKRIKNIDELIRKGEFSVVDEISKGHGIGNRIFYSFATKYCSWHNKDTFPIYDSYIESILKKYLKNKNRPESKSNFRLYNVFINALREFKTAYNLNSSISEIDKFLWIEAKEKMQKDKDFKWKEYEVENSHS